MKTTLTIALCSLSILVFGCLKSFGSDSSALQGTWSGQEVGTTITGSPSLTIKGAKLVFHGVDTNEWYTATFKLREDKSPKQLEAVITDCPVLQYVGKTGQAIYKIEDGKLTLTGNEPGNPAVPTSFDAQGAREFIFTKK